MTTEAHSLCICVALFKKPVIKLSADSLSLVVQLIDIPRACMRDPHYGPERLSLALALMGLVLRVTHLLCVFIEDLIM